MQYLKPTSTQQATYTKNQSLTQEPSANKPLVDISHRIGSSGSRASANTQFAPAPTHTPPSHHAQDWLPASDTPQNIHTWRRRAIHLPGKVVSSSSRTWVEHNWTEAILFSVSPSSFAGQVERTRTHHRHTTRGKCYMCDSQDRQLDHCVGSSPVVSPPLPPRLTIVSRLSAMASARWNRNCFVSGKQGTEANKT